MNRKLKLTVVRMKIVITTDSEVLNDRLQKMLGGIQDIVVEAKGKDMDEACRLVNSTEADALIISFNRINTQVFNKLLEIKNGRPDLVVIVLSSYPFVQYKIEWKKAGADYVFDQAMQFSKMVDVLCDLLYKHKLGVLLSKKALTNKSSIT